MLAMMIAPLESIARKERQKQKDKKVKKRGRGRFLIDESLKLRLLDAQVINLTSLIDT